MTVYFSEAAPDGYEWYKYSTVNSWQNYSANATFSADRRSVVLALEDGGTGDADGTANGIIVDPGGFGIFESYIINLNPGWNLISLSRQPGDPAIETVLATISGLFSSVWTYRGNTWMVYDPDNPGFSDLTIMEAGWGYWIDMTEPANLIANGTPPSAGIALENGWNLVGFNASIPLPAANAMASIDSQYESVWVFIDGAWRVYDPNNPGLSDLGQIEPGYGYWINTTEACTWTLP